MLQTQQNGWRKLAFQKYINLIHFEWYSSANVEIISVFEYIINQLYFEINVNSSRILNSMLKSSVNILPLFTSISKDNC